MPLIVVDGATFRCPCCPIPLTLTVPASLLTVGEKRVAFKGGCFFPAPGLPCSKDGSPCPGIPPGHEISEGQSVITIAGATALGHGCTFICPHKGITLNAQDAGQSILTHNEAYINQGTIETQALGQSSFGGFLDKFSLLRALLKKQFREGKKLPKNVYELFPKREDKFIYINGILTPLDIAKENRDYLSEKLKKPVDLCYNKMSSFPSDMWGAAKETIHQRTNEVDKAEKCMRNAIREQKNGRVWLIEHSRGALTGDEALKKLSAEQRSKIVVVTFGAPRLAMNRDTHQNINYTNLGDPIQLVRKPISLLLPSLLPLTTIANIARDKLLAPNNTEVIVKQKVTLNPINSHGIKKDYDESIDDLKKRIEKS